MIDSVNSTWKATEYWEKLTLDRNEYFFKIMKTKYTISEVGFN